MHVIWGGSPVVYLLDIVVHACGSWNMADRNAMTYAHYVLLSYTITEVDASVTISKLLCTL